MISIRSLRHGILDIDALDIPRGITSVIGPNGSGKTTLLKILSGIALAEQGSVLVEGRPPRELNTGWVNEFPDRNILFDNVDDEVASPLMFHKADCADTTDRVSSVMTDMGISALHDRTVQELSGGEKILVALAAAVILRPDLLVLDEYDSHLDCTRARQIEDYLNRCGIPYIIRCTQQMETAARSSTVVFLDEGKVASQGNPAEVFALLKDTAFYPVSMRCGL